MQGIERRISMFLIFKRKFSSKKESKLHNSHLNDNFQLECIYQPKIGLLYSEQYFVGFLCTLKKKKRNKNDFILQIFLNQEKLTKAINLSRP